MTSQIAPARDGTPWASAAIGVKAVARAASRISGPALVLIVAIGCWLSSLVGVNLRSMNAVGLLSVMPVTFFVSLALLTAGFMFTFDRYPDRRGLLAGYLAVAGDGHPRHTGDPLRNRSLLVVVEAHRRRRLHPAPRRPRSRRPVPGHLPQLAGAVRTHGNGLGRHGHRDPDHRDLDAAGTDPSRAPRAVADLPGPRRRSTDRLAGAVARRRSATGWARSTSHRRASRSCSI